MSSSDSDSEWEPSVVSRHVARVSDWFAYCRKLVSESFIGGGRKRIGGRNKIVQIDEAKFGRRKYHRVVEGHWLIGMIEDGSDDLRLELCPHNIRSAEVLIPLIQKHVHPGTTIRTDQWRAYIALTRFGYRHQVVNYSREFVTEDGVHTNRIGSMWRPMRAYFRTRQIGDDVFADHVVEYQWRRICRISGSDSFELFLSFIRQKYPVKRPLGPL